MFCESLHNKIKTYYMDRKQNKRVDKLLDVLFEMERDIYLQHLYRIKIGCPPTDIPPSYQKRHTKGMNIPDTDCTKVNDLLWTVISQADNTRTTYYYVSKLSDTCNFEHCFVKCVELACLQLCDHLYFCTCADASGVCKHIHKVHSLQERQVMRSHGLIEEEPQLNFLTPQTLLREMILKILRTKRKN